MWLSSFMRPHNKVIYPNIVCMRLLLCLFIATIPTPLYAQLTVEQVGACNKVHGVDSTINLVSGHVYDQVNSGNRDKVKAFLGACKSQFTTLEEKAAYAYMLAGYFFYADRMDSAHLFFAESEQLYQSAGLEEKAMNSRVRKLEYIRSIDPPKALKEFNEIAAYYLQKKDSSSYYDVLYHITTVHYGLGDFDKAIAMRREMKAYYEREGRADQAASINYGLGNYYFTKSVDTARMYYEEAIRLMEISSEYPNLVYAHQACGGLLRGVDSVASWYHLRIADSLNTRHDVRSPMLGKIIGKSHFLEGRTEMAIESAMESYRLSKENHILFIVIQCCNELATYHEDLGNFKEAYAFHTEYVAMRDSIRGDKELKDLGKYEAEREYSQALHDQELKAQADAFEQEQEIESQRAFNNYLTIGLIGAGVLALLLLWSYRRKRTANKVISKQKAELEKMDILNKKIFSVISHDFKGPMMSMGFFADTLQQEELTDIQRDELAKDIRNNVEQTTAILENLVNWARAELKFSLSDTHGTEVATIVGEVLQQLHTRIQSKSLSIQNEIPSHLEANIHPDILRITYRNLLSNAIKYSHEGKSIRIGYSEENEEFFIRDLGVGIAQEKLSKLFKTSVFSGLGTAQESGFGIGLYITGELLNKSGWSIRAVSVKGQGTTFFFRPKA